MVRAATTERNDVVDFHPWVGIAARCADAGGTNSLHVIGTDLSSRNLTNPSIMSGGIVDLFGAFGVFLAPFRLLMIQARAVFIAIFRRLFAVMIWFLGFGARDLRSGIARVTTIGSALLLSEMLRVLFARLSAVGVKFVAVLRSIFGIVGAAFLLIFRMPSLLIGAVPLRVLGSPQFRASPRFDLSFFRAIHGATMPWAATANNYAV